MSSPQVRVGLATVFSWFFLPTVAQATILDDLKANIVLFTHGTSVYEVARVNPLPGAQPPSPAVKRRAMDLEPDQLASLATQDVTVGYKWQFDGIFWLDFWTWDGEYCVVEDGNKYHPITPAQAAYLTGKDSPPAKPLRYRVPRGLTLLVIVTTLIFLRLATLPKPTDDEPTTAATGVKAEPPQTGLPDASA